MVQKWWQLKQQEDYLEINLSNTVTLNNKKRILYLHDDMYLTCFIHPKDESYILCDCGNHTSLKKYMLNYKVNQALLSSWLKSMIEALEEASPDCCILSIDTIFIHNETSQLQLLRLPITTHENNLIECINEIFEYINFDGDDEWLSQLYMTCKQRPFRVGTLLRFLEEKPHRSRFSFLFQRKKREEDTFFQAFEVHEQFANYNPVNEQTQLLEQDDFKTQVMMIQGQYGYLIDDNSQEYFISEMPFILGRQNTCQCVLSYPEVSKQHVKIDVENGQCVLFDMGSTNGTFVNDQRLEPQEKRSLKEGDVIGIANYKLTYHE